MSVDFTQIIFAILQIFLLGLSGFVLVKRQIIEAAGLKLLSNLLISFFLPCFMFYQLTQHFHFETYPNWWLFPLLSLAISLAGFVIGWVVLQLFPWINFKKEFISLVIFQNSGYLPLILVATIFSGEAAERLSNYIFLFLVGFNPSMWSLGVWLITKRQARFELKHIFNPPFIAIIVSLLFIFLGWQRFLPEVLLRPVRMFSDCTLPLAMMTVGGNLAAMKIPALDQRAVLAVVFSKLILLPLLAIGIIQFFNIDFLIGFLILIETVVPSAVTLSIITRYFGIEERFINQGLFFSHLASLATIPFFLMYYIHLRAPAHGI